MFYSKYFPVRSVTLVALQNASAVATLELSGKMGKRGVQGAWAACVDSTDAFRRETVDEKWWSTGFSAVSSELGAEFGPGTSGVWFPSGRASMGLSHITLSQDKWSAFLTPSPVFPGRLDRGHPKCWTYPSCPEMFVWDGVRPCFLSGPGVADSLKVNRRTFVIMANFHRNGILIWEGLLLLLLGMECLMQLIYLMSLLLERMSVSLSLHGQILTPM